MILLARNEAGGGKVTTLKGSGTHLGVRAAGTPGMAGLIRAHELRGLKIPHALAVAVPNTVLKSGFVWPAKSQDTDGAYAYSGQVPMGSLFAIPGSVNLAGLGLSAEGLALGKALQNYGAYVVDRSGMGMGNIGFSTGAEPLPRNAETKGWAVDAGGNLNFDGIGFLACPSFKGSYVMCE